jgi:hypothetical protein
VPRDFNPLLHCFENLRNFAILSSIKAVK